MHSKCTSATQAISNIWLGLFIFTVLDIHFYQTYEQGYE